MTQAFNKAKIPHESLNEVQGSGILAENSVSGSSSVSSVNYEKENETTVLALFSPSKAIKGLALCPEEALGMQIKDEANSIINQFAAFRKNDFDGNLLLDVADPFPELPMGAKVNCSIVFSAILQRIQIPPENFPVLCGLKSGSYICDVCQIWPDDTAVNIALFKP